MKSLVLSRKENRLNIAQCCTQNRESNLMACKVCNTATNRAHRKFSTELMSPEKNPSRYLPDGKGGGHLWYPTDVHRNEATSCTFPPSELWDILMGQSLVYISEGALEEHHYEVLVVPLGAFAGVLIRYRSCLKNIHHRAVTSEMN